MAKSRKYSRKKSRSPKRKLSRNPKLKKSRSPKRKSIKKTSVRTKSACNQLLKKKIRKNMDEYKSGRYSSRQQALAVSYSQVKKMSPYCSRYFKKK